MSILLAESRRLEMREVAVESGLVAVLEGMPDGFIGLDQEGRCIYVNAAAERLLGRTRAELLGQELAARLPPSHVLRSPELGPMGSAPSPGSAPSTGPLRAPVELEAYEEPLDRWLEVRACPTETGGVSIFLRDVSDRRRAEEELRRSQRELMDFFENATEGLHWVGPDGTILWANRAELSLLGYTREEYIGRSIREFHADADTIEDILCRLTTGGELYNYEARLRCKDGSIRHVLISSNALWFEDQFIHTRCFTRDITDRKQALLELEVAEQRFSRFMENLPGLAWMKDLEGRYVYVNAAAARAFQAYSAEVYGKRDEEIFPPETAAQFRENDRLALESAHGILVIEALEREGRVHHSLVSKFPVLDVGALVTGVGGMAIDITERIRAEEALRAADRRKDEFLAMLAHELRNPLAPILTAVELFRIRGGEDALLKRQSEVIGRQVRHMKRLLDDLLDVSRITRGKVELTMARVDLAAILRQAVETSRPVLEERGHTLHISLPDMSLTMVGDADRLYQVFTNLLNNAARYTPAGGTIRLTARREGGTARVSVKDTGVGMSPELLAEAFDLFTQGERGLDRSQGGLGIGLTLVRELTERHGGSVTAASEGPGRGSEFVVTLPLAGEDPGTEGP